MLLARRNQNYNQNWLPSLFNDFMNDDWFTTRTAASVPALNVIENEKNYELEFAVPGLKKEELNLQVDADGVMSISMVHKNEENKEDKKRNYIRREFSYQEFNQSYILPEDADREKISAKVEHKRDKRGILRSFAHAAKPLARRNRLVALSKVQCHAVVEFPVVCDVSLEHRGGVAAAELAERLRACRSAKNDLSLHF